MGLWEAFSSFLSYVHDSALGVDRAAELRRKKKAAARRRYRANRAIRRSAAVIDLSNIDSASVPDVVVSPSSQGNDTLLNPEDASTADVMFGDTEAADSDVDSPNHPTVGDDSKLAVLEVNDSNISVDPGPITSKADVHYNQRLANPSVDMLAEVGFVPVEVANDVCADDIIVEDDGNIDPLLQEGSIAGGLPAVGGRVLDQILPNIPKFTMSNDPVWSSGLLPDVMGLVLEADDAAKVYVIPRSFFGIQAYTAKELHGQHCVMDMPTDLPLYFMGLPKPVEVVWYTNADDHNDEFFVVKNRPGSVLSGVGPDYPFEELLVYTREREGVEDGQLSRQRAKLNRGFTGTQSMPGRDSNGHPQPQIKEGTHDPVVVQSLICASNYARRLPVPWNQGRPLEVPPKRTRLFAARIADGVLFEGVTHTTNQRCGWHRDYQNPPPSETAVSQVTCINRRMTGGGYIVSIYYFRLSISVNIERNVNADPIIQHYVETYHSFPPERRRFTRSTVGTGRGFCSVLPNLDTISFHSLVDVSAVSLMHRFGLNTIESISLVVAYLFMPNTAEPFARAAIRLLKDGRMGRNVTGYRVGYKVLTWMLQEQRSFNVRFNVYRPDPVVEEDAFEENTTSLFWLIVHVWAAFPTRPGTTVVAKSYAAIRDLLKSLFTGVGNLIAMHALQMLAELGLLPSWLQTYASFDHNGRVFRWYADRFQFPPTAVQARRLMSSLPTAINNYIDGFMHESILENLSCKNFQRAGGGAEPRRDVHHHKAPIVCRGLNGTGLMIVLANGAEIQLESNCLVPKWRFGDCDMKMEEIAAFLELPRALPGLRSLGGSRLPDEVHSRPPTSNIPYDLPRWYS